MSGAMPYAMGSLPSPQASREISPLPDLPSAFAPFLADDDDGDALANAARTSSMSATDMEQSLSLRRTSSAALTCGGSCLGRSIDNTSERKSFKYPSLNENPR
jgi:hypothetical protein